jgi:hypothetical protein
MKWKGNLAKVKLDFHQALVFCVNDYDVKNLKDSNKKSDDCLIAHLVHGEGIKSKFGGNQDFVQVNPFEKKKIGLLYKIDIDINPNHFICGSPSILFEVISYLSPMFEFFVPPVKQVTKLVRYVGNSVPSEVNKQREEYKEDATKKLKVDCAVASSYIREICGLSFYKTSARVLGSFVSLNPPATMFLEKPKFVCLKCRKFSVDSSECKCPENPRN